MIAAQDETAIRTQALARLAEGVPGVVWKKIIADTETPVGAALKLFEPERGDFLLESVEGGETRGRYSLLGLDPDLVFRAQGDACEVNREWWYDREAFVALPGGALAELRALVEACRFPVPEELPPALACLVGYFGYETVGLVEKLPRAPANEIGMPDMLFVRPSVILVFDRLGDELYCVAPIWPSTTEPEQALDRASERIDEVLRRLALPIPDPDGATDLPEPQPQPIVSAAEYASRVMQAKAYIEAGDIFQVVLAQRFTCPFTLAPIALYRALRRVNPSPFLYFLDLPGFALTGSSPEILVRVRDGEVTIRPIAGTRPRGSTPSEDRANEASLLADPKERAEHLMLLDLGRNDVGRVAKAGTVEVTGSYTIERYSHVMHIVSNVVGRLDAAKHDAIDAVFAGFPAGTVSGAPKVRACEVIAELEHEARGAYGGGVGYFAPDGSVDSCIVLRTAVVKDGVMHVQAGAGIVADSDPAYEQRECEAKAGALFAAAREAVRIAGEPGFGQ
ncbi:anthranilate synthase component I [Novosphingobium aquimarinum]|uniref:anthranilate synthase component I n=1 Tax=Novosphingobium aquimarinum TaxID=2682494 RepID=UPI0012EC104E|nr:anthranilate synthase component I [Novosphingobium aquimarinum]